MNASDNRFYRTAGDAITTDRDLAEAIHHEIISPERVDAALALWQQNPHLDERTRMWIVLANASGLSIDAVLARRQPGFWMDETSGVLRPAIEAYLHGDAMTAEQVAAMRAYLRQWIAAPHWAGADALEELRDGVDALTSRFAIAAWLDRANQLGIDPL